MAQVEVVYCPTSDTIIRLAVEVEQGACVAEALAQSGVFSSHPEAQGLAVGVFGKRVTLDTVVAEGERIELYRPLQLDPMERRRARAKR